MHWSRYDSTFLPIDSLTTPVSVPVYSLRMETGPLRCAIHVIVDIDRELDKVPNFIFLWQHAYACKCAGYMWMQIGVFGTGWAKVMLCFQSWRLPDSQSFLYGICVSCSLLILLLSGATTPEFLAFCKFLPRHASCNFRAVSSVKLCVNSEFLLCLCLTTLSHKILVLIRFSYCIFGGSFLNVKFAISYSRPL